MKRFVATLDVDLLRPGTVPLPPGTILWFEFLLDPELLKRHLSKPSPKPSPCALIVEFLSVDATLSEDEENPQNERIVDVDAPGSPAPSSATDNPEMTRRELALKIMALKVAATIRWNIDIFEKQLPPHIQYQLMQDLMYMATDTLYTEPSQDIPPDILKKPQVQFALTLYHRWSLRFPVVASLHAKTTKMPVIHIPGMPVENGYNPLNPHFENILRTTEASRMQNIRFLEDILAYYETNKRNETRRIKIPCIDTFIHLTEDYDELNHDWNISDICISHHELAMQIHFDLCYNYFFYAQHELAKKHILSCRDHYNRLEREVLSCGYGKYRTVPWGQCNYASVQQEEINAYVRALNLGYEILGEEPSLLQKLQVSVSNEYAGIIPILQDDNISRELSLVQRQIVELDIEGATSAGVLTMNRDLIDKVTALNAVRYVIEGGIPSTHPDFINKFETVGITFCDLLFWALGPVLLSNLSEEEWENFRMFFLHLLTSQSQFPIERIDEYLKKYTGDSADKIRHKLISDHMLNRIVNDPNNLNDEDIDLPKELLTDDWETPGFEYKSISELEMGRLKKHLIEASTADDIRMCLVKLAMMAPASPLWKLSPTWKPAGNLTNALTTLPRGFLQDFGYVVSGTARARAETGNARVALSLLNVLEAEVRGQMGNSTDSVLYRLCRLLSWEVLLMQVNVLLSEWPNHRLNLTTLASKCKTCIAACNTNDNCMPRPQVIDACWIYLVNACEWDVSGSGPCTAVGDAAAAMCTICYELQKGKSNRKFPRQLWDNALAAYINVSVNAVKRNAAGVPTHSRETYCGSDARTQFNYFLSTLREPLAISIGMSLLTRIYNIIVDDSILELTVEYISLWPATISNVNLYSSKHILESLTDLLERSLKLYPYNISWLRLYGDVEAAAGRYGAGLRRYLCALASSSWHFTERATDEAAIARRMVRCCQSLGALTQAAALCQLPDEPDYGPAFKCLAEKGTNVSDAMDAYYSCVWDVTLLEVAISFHSRRGEGGRRTRAVKAAGALELNSNNSDEILREAASVRRSRLLRALAKQYVA